MTNSASGNAVEAFARASDGSLTPAGTYPTGPASREHPSALLTGAGANLKISEPGRPSWHRY